ncbi:30S ribosomal protein S20 [Tumebacillus permanentifrigoris]|uniref:Small ribosomal subunit protein bS20 n=1 Tax=Tumebacillus permanentifrigoris TaxID=378543 RepID=A0A316D5A3_9BACL|nr:30S ribosomal protein S20 [Tumebacillus permanentifrigoris]PWK08379.1 SSU ribosomal protein S20P [Tumebacillus permanentifrigoris]
MPNIKSAIKRVKTISTRTLRNAAAKSALRTAVKKFEVAIAANDANSAALLKQANRALDKAVTKGLVHKNTAARKKSRLTKKFNQANLSA